MFFLNGTLFLFGEFATCELPVNRLLVFAADKMRAWYSVSRSEPAGDSETSIVQNVWFVKTSLGSLIAYVVFVVSFYFVSNKNLWQECS